jgi:para-aminobenzoate synthetase component I
VAPLPARLLEPSPPVTTDLLDLAGTAEDAAVLTVRGWQVLAIEPVAAVTDIADLDEAAARSGWHQPPRPGDPPFVGGLVGYVSDDCSPGLLGLAPDSRPPTPPHPPLRFAAYDTALCVSPDGDAWLVAADLPGMSREPATERLDRLRRRIDGTQPTAPARGHATTGPRTSLSRADHRAALDRIQGWITAGDLYQLNLTLQVEVGWQGGGVPLARRLWAASAGAAHAAYLRLPSGVEIVSVSPETFLRTDGDTVVTRPIKGTRPRRADPDDDAAQARALVDSDKDRAEHVMIVDLERNDLGRVCVPGSVTVPALAAREAHPTVWHLTSTIRGTLRPGVGLGGLLAATFPSGSVTGAPKRMAVERTRLVEPVRRGVYCGAVGAVSAGLADFSVAIRTAVVAHGAARYGTGGGIVADSRPDAEWAEAMDKAAAFLTATGVGPAS